MAAGITMVEENHVESIEKPKLPMCKDFEQKFLDYFYQLAHGDADIRQTASVNVIRSVLSSRAPGSQLVYTVGRLVQGLASSRQCARHGFYVTLIALLNATTSSQLSDQLVLDLVEKRLQIKGSKSERNDLLIGQVLAYGALLKSGRNVNKDELKIILQQILTHSKHKSYIQPIAFAFVTEYVQQIQRDTFKEVLWPILKQELARNWEQHNFDSLNLLLTVGTKFPKAVKKSFFQEHLGSEKIIDSSTFDQLVTFILANSCHSNHPLLAQLVSLLHENGSLIEFWESALDPAIKSVAKSKVSVTLHLLKSALLLVDNDEIERLLSINILSCLTSHLILKDEPSSPIANEVLEVIKAKLTDQSITSQSQTLVVVALVKKSGYVVFDNNTDTRFMAEVTPFLKKETLQSLSDIYRHFITESSETADQITAIQYLAKLVGHPALQRGEFQWKADQLVFLAEWAFFNKTALSSLSTAARDNFYRALDSPCKRLEDYAEVLLLTVDRLNTLMAASSFPDQLKMSWEGIQSSVKKICKKRCTSNSNLWVENVFLVLFLNMGLQNFREPKLAQEVVEELNSCYRKAAEKRSKSTRAKIGEEEPHWLEVVTDILLSLLSQNQHLLRSIVLSVWSSMVSRLTPGVLQQVLDVIDPTKKEAPLMGVDDDESTDSNDSDEGEREKQDEEANEDEGDVEEEDDTEEEAEGEQLEDDDAEESDGIDDGEPETVTDKLRARIHEALGDGAALTDTESIDIDDLSDGGMKSLDNALSAAFKEFRKSRPVRKNKKKLPKDVTALMHFRLRCLDMIELLSSSDKEVHINLIVPAITPLLALLEATVKEPLQKPLMNRTRLVLRKITSMRRFSNSSDDTVLDSLVSLLQTLFSKCNSRKPLMPYIGEDLAYCCTFVLRCSLHLSPQGTNVSVVTKSASEPRVQVESIYQLYQSSLSKFFRKRDSPIPSIIFSRALQYPWPDAGFLLEPLISYAFGSDSLTVKSRKLQALSLLTLLFRNTTALSALGTKLLHQILSQLLNNAQKVLDEATKETKPRFICDMFTLLAVVHQSCGDSNAPIKLDYQPTQHWDDLKVSVTRFLCKQIVKERDVKKGYSILARSLDLPTAVKAIAQTTNCMEIPPVKIPSAGTKEVEVAKGPVKATTSKANKRANAKRLVSQKKKEEKMRQREAADKGMDTVTFTGVNLDQVIDAGEVSRDVGKTTMLKTIKRTKAMSDTGDTEEAPKGAERTVKLKKMRKTMATDNIEDVEKDRVLDTNGHVTTSKKTKKKSEISDQEPQRQKKKKS